MLSISIPNFDISLESSSKFNVKDKSCRNWVSSEEILILNYQEENSKLPNPVLLGQCMHGLPKPFL